MLKLISKLNMQTQLTCFFCLLFDMSSRIKYLALLFRASLAGYLFVRVSYLSEFGSSHVGATNPINVGRLRRHNSKGRSTFGTMWVEFCRPKEAWLAWSDCFASKMLPRNTILCNSISQTSPPLTARNDKQWRCELRKARRRHPPGT